MLESFRKRPGRKTKEVRLTDVIPAKAGIQSGFPLSKGMTNVLKGLHIRKASLTSRKLAKHIAQYAADTKAEDIIILDLRSVANFCDFFVIVTGTSNRHLNAIVDDINEGSSALGVQATAKHSRNDSDWVIADYGDVVVHVFTKEAREFYQLEYLWREAKPVKWE